ncbi:MAG: hypothetical protein CL840_06210 [Crocinitomicaceae bacterium]|nr:hypothetical protein [Crocinitomicaceae bacterium]|tara:strand:+ start:2002 stop:3636 length:1635 start_codon:yes stop_codon:yes gene_type:complete
MSKRKSVEDIITKSEKTSLAWLENSPVCTKIIDKDFNLQYMSHAGISGLKIEDVEAYYGKPYPFHFFPEWSKSSMIENLEKVKKEGKVITIEMSALDLEENELWFHATLTPVFSENGELDYIMVVSTDITKRINIEKKIKIKNDEIKAQNKRYEVLNEELKRSNEQLRKAKIKAEESEKLKSAFLANMSHEIRTPLNSILGFTNLLKINKTLAEEEKEQFFSYIESGGNRLLRIISDIVDISKLNAKQLSILKEECDLNELIDSLKNQLSIQLNNNEVELATTKGLSNENSTVVLDPIRLAQILSNLIENAGKYTNQGKIEFGYRVEKNMIKFHVSDTGIGISKKDQKKIFNRFSQVNGSNSGTGLGLSIASELTVLMNGNIWVESDLGKGATFYFTIPFKPATKSKNGVKKDVFGQAKNNGFTVLIAEDEKLNFIYLEALLREYGYRIIHAKNGKEAVELVKNNDSIDLVLMDTRMPEMDGVEATIEIRKSLKSIPIIAQTAYVGAEDKKKAFEAGIDGYLEKPITKSMIDELLVKYVTQESV